MNSNFDQETIFIALSNAKSLEVLTYSAGQIQYYAPDFLGAQFYLLVKKVPRKSKSARLIEKQPETFIFVLCHLNRTYSFHFHFISIKRFYNEALAV